MQGNKIGFYITQSLNENFLSKKVWLINDCIIVYETSTLDILKSFQGLLFILETFTSQYGKRIRNQIKREESTLRELDGRGGLQKNLIS